MAPHQPPQPEPPNQLKALGSWASSITALVSLAALIFWSAWYFAKQEGGGANVQSLTQAVATMDARITGKLAAAEKLRDADADEVRRISREMALLQAAQERIRAEADAERRMRDAELQRILAEAAWLRQQLIEMRGGGPRRQSGDGPEDEFDPPSQTGPDVREAARPAPLASTLGIAR